MNPITDTAAAELTDGITIEGRPSSGIHFQRWSASAGCDGADIDIVRRVRGRLPKAERIGWIAACDDGHGFEGLFRSGLIPAERRFFEAKTYSEACDTARAIFEEVQP